jgi:hypothetical protein
MGVPLVRGEVGSQGGLVNRGVGERLQSPRFAQTRNSATPVRRGPRVAGNG